MSTSKFSGIVDLILLGSAVYLAYNGEYATAILGVAITQLNQIEQRILSK